MAEEKMDYSSMLADMEAKKAALETAIASLRAALAAGALGAPGDLPVGAAASLPTAVSGDIPTGAFLGKSIPAAIKLYLAAMRKKCTTREMPLDTTKNVA